MPRVGLIMPTPQTDTAAVKIYNDVIIVPTMAEKAESKSTMHVVYVSPREMLIYIY